MELQQLKNQLAIVSSFHFKTSTNQVLNGWEGEGIGTVKTVWENNDALLFYEEGRFTNLQNRSMKCSNIYRWSFDAANSKIGLQHLRFGFDKPVFLFDLIFESATQLISACPHLCGPDEYSAAMRLEEKSVLLDWTIQKKIDFNKIAYLYQ